MILVRNRPGEETDECWCNKRGKKVQFLQFLTGKFSTMLQLRCETAVLVMVWGMKKKKCSSSRVSWSSSAFLRHLLTTRVKYLRSEEQWLDCLWNIFRVSSWEEVQCQQVERGDCDIKTSFEQSTLTLHWDLTEAEVDTELDDCLSVVEWRYAILLWVILSRTETCLRTSTLAMTLSPAMTAPAVIVGKKMVVFTASASSCCQSVVFVLSLLSSQSTGSFN